MILQQIADVTGGQADDELDLAGGQADDSLDIE